METELQDIDTSALNIVAVKPVEVESQPKRKKRKLNKYEKRRRKQKASRQDASSTKSTPATTIATASHLVAKQTQEKMVVVEAPSLSCGTERGDGNQIEEVSEPATSENPDRATTHSTTTTTPTKNNYDSVATLSTSTTTLPADPEARAAYLAEFHARPLELDRRAGATRFVPRSRVSKHVFDTAWDEGLPQLHPRLRRAGREVGGEKLTTIQAQAIPFLLSPDHRRRHVMIHSETGSGKTLAYLLPILHNVHESSPPSLKRESIGTRCIVVCPTRELTVQTTSSAETVTRKLHHAIVPGRVLGDENRSSEKARLRKGCAVVVGTPGRLLDHIRRTVALADACRRNPESLSWLVLDEADRLLDMGFGPTIEQIVQELRSIKKNWRCVLVSATVTPVVQEWAKATWGTSWEKIGGAMYSKESVQPQIHDVADQLARSTPLQLAQYHMVVSAKWRLAALIAFLTERLDKRIVVFMSTCASVDFHHALFAGMSSIVGSEKDKGKGTRAASLFGQRSKIFKLHGNVPHVDRQHVLQRFSKLDGGAVLLATDVAARGLNLHAVDWTVQYDPPAEVTDYVHRAGRVARAGQAGHALLLLLPSEKDFLHVLKRRGLPALKALSLSSTLNGAAKVCTELANCGIQRSGGASSSKSREGEGFALELQQRLEVCVYESPPELPKIDEGRKAKKRKGGSVLLDMAQNAFLSHIRAYPTREKTVRQIFSAKALHLGHVARSFALREPPKRVGDSGKKRKPNDDDDTSSRLSFRTKNQDYSKQGQRTASSSSFNPHKARKLLQTNASRLQAGDMSSF